MPVNILVYLRNSSSFQKNYQFYDDVCAQEFHLGFEPGQVRDRYICSNGTTDSGYGKILYRMVGTVAWSERSLIDNGETIDLF